MYPEAIQYGIKEENNTKLYYSKVSEKQHSSFELEEPGLLISRQYSWIGASLDGIRKCQCCDPSVVEFKCPFTGKDLDPKISFLLPSIGGKKIKRGSIFLMKITYIIFKFRLAWLFQVSKPVILLHIQVKAYF